MGAGWQRLTQPPGQSKAPSLAACSHNTFAPYPQQTALSQSAVQTTALIPMNPPSPIPIPSALLFQGLLLFHPHTVYTPAVFIAADPAFPAPQFQAKKSQAPPASSYQPNLPPPGSSHLAVRRLPAGMPRSGRDLAGAFSYKRRSPSCCERRAAASRTHTSLPLRCHGGGSATSGPIAARRHRSYPAPSSPGDGPAQAAPAPQRTVTVLSAPPEPPLRLSPDTEPGGPGPLRADGKSGAGGRGGQREARPGPCGSSARPEAEGGGPVPSLPSFPAAPARSRTSLFRTMPRARRRPMPLSAPSSSATPARLISSFPPPGPGPGPGPDIAALPAAEQARPHCAGATPPAPPMRASEAVRLHGNGHLLTTARAHRRRPAPRPARKRPRLRPRPGAPPAPRHRSAQAVPEGPPSAPLAQTSRKLRPSPTPCRKFPFSPTAGSPAPCRGCTGSSALSPASRRGRTGSSAAQRRLYRQGSSRSPAQGRRRGGPALVNSRR